MLLFYEVFKEIRKNIFLGQQCTNQGPPEFSWESFGLEYIPEESILYLE